MSRERALNQIVSLKALAEDRSTTEPERQRAREAIVRLRAKYNIPESTGADYLKRIAEQFERGRREAKRKADERAAQETRDHGAPLTDEERAWARRDPFGFAQARDGRTQAEKQRDMQNSWGQPRPQPKQRPRQGPWRCAEPYTFFDPGGVPRQRNAHRIKCQKCGITLEAGEGCVTVIGAYCCETTPGPRKKNSRSTGD